MSRGFIKIYRDLQDHWLWQEPQKLKWWLDIIMMANIKDNKMLKGSNLVTISRGSFHTSEVHLSTRWGVNRKTVNSFLKLLEEDEMIALEKTKNGTTIEVLNYKAYQDKNELQRTTERADKRTDDGTEERTQSKKGKNAKECKETIYSVLKSYTSDKELDEALRAFVEMRTKARKPLTVRSFKQALSKLDELSQGNLELKIKLVDYAVQKGWLTFYEIKDNYKQTGYANKAEQMVNGMYQHDWDLDELEKKQRERIVNKVKEREERVKHEKEK